LIWDIYLYRAKNKKLDGMRAVGILGSDCKKWRKEASRFYLTASLGGMLIRFGMITIYAI